MRPGLAVVCPIVRVVVRLILSGLPGLLLLAPSVAQAGKAIDGVVNLNTAPAEVLALLPGIGPAKATAILQYRKRRPFRTVDELVRIKGVGRKMVRRLRPHLAVGGPTTATAAPPRPVVSTDPSPKPVPAIPAAPRARGGPPPLAVPHGALATHARPPARSTQRQRPRGNPWPAPCLGPP